MATREITELQRIFQSRLDTLDHILDVGGKHLDLEAALHERLAPDMLPLGSQVALACNQPRGFSQWCGGKPVEHLPWAVESVEQEREIGSAACRDRVCQYVEIAAVGVTLKKKN